MIQSCGRGPVTRAAAMQARVLESSDVGAFPLARRPARRSVLRSGAHPTRRRSALSSVPRTREGLGRSRPSLVFGPDASTVRRMRVSGSSLILRTRIGRVCFGGGCS
ncbi:hypothetical protein BDY21DRAFT_71403 [Lineolata rhizophorae]|uniref:Uncharacterized protein n=1 Tax=Lineolata rhizophorae TaxID=578093 RepID=A0A6A6NUU5_9PEZI|nr:hypothetical protein BDY21DRAFT_71403 [Lineolata rhizophorae]